MPPSFRQVSNWELCCDALNHLHQVCSDASDTDPYTISIDVLLEHCDVDDCPLCSVVCCPHQSPVHFHASGCPACTAAAKEAELAEEAEVKEPKKWSH